MKRLLTEILLQCTVVGEDGGLERERVGRSKGEKVEGWVERVRLREERRRLVVGWK
jgi:hypothetical protein